MTHNMATLFEFIALIVTVIICMLLDITSRWIWIGIFLLTGTIIFRAFYFFKRKTKKQ